MEFVSRETLEKWLFVEATYLEEFNERNRLQLTQEQLDLLIEYARFIWETNQIINLVSRKDEINILRKHICHGLALNILAKDYKFKSVVDFGTGGGIPGIPYAISHPDTTVILTDSIQKKITELDGFILHNKLPNVKTVRSRIEEWKPTGRVNAIMSRGVGTIRDTVQWTKSIRAENKGLVYLFLKGGDLEEEFGQAAKFMKTEVTNVKILPLQFFGSDMIGEDKSLIILETK